MTALWPLVLQLVSKALEIFAQADGAERLKEWLTKSVDELEAIRKGLKPPP